MGAFRNTLNRLVSPWGLKIIPQHTDQLTYQHDYGSSGGFQRYKELQIFHNKRKFERVWAEDRTLGQICEYLKPRKPARGICHGARNGWEVAKFRETLNCDVIGSDISQTAADLPNMVVHDFHEVNPEWFECFDFIYTNSLDQAFDPRKALASWAGQLTKEGLIFIEHTIHHSPSGASEMDPFGAHPMVMPYLFFEWGKGLYDLRDIIHVSDVDKKGHVWVFVLGRAH
jgi:hypothetical protein